MKKNEIKSKELKRILEAKFDVFDFKDIKDEDLETMEKLFVRKRKLSGEETDIDLSEIFNFKNLKELRLLGFELTNSDIKMISNMGLESLALSNCVFEKVDSLKELFAKSQVMAIHAGACAETEKTVNLTIRK